MKQLVAGGPDGKPDWDMIRGTNSVRSGDIMAPFAH
jgi:hypothetical protein